VLVLGRNGDERRSFFFKKWKKNLLNFPQKQGGENLFTWRVG